jgi:hypothetical protein
MRASPTVPAPTPVEFAPVAEQAMSRHPMEVFPVFRRWKCGFWRDIVYTGLWNTMLAVIFTLFWIMYEPQITLTRMLTLNLIFAQCIGYTIHFLFLLTDRLIQGRSAAHWRHARSTTPRSPFSGLRGLLDRWVCSVSPSRRRIF